MSSLTHTVKLLENKLEDLQRDSKFCVNNYDYHHKNNEFEIMENLHDILKESLKDGKEFLSRMADVRSLITSARKKCSELDELLLDVGISPEAANSSTFTNGATGNCKIGSQSFTESNENEDLEANKENKN